VTACLVSVNVGRPEPWSWAAIGRSSIRKQQVAGPVLVTTVGLDGDQVSDTRHHGGADQAVYAFAREDLDRWADLLGRPVPDGQFGENLTTQGIDVNEAEVGERWAIGSAVFEVASVRIPCDDFKGWLGHSGFDNAGWVKRFTAEGRPGPYLRVVEEGLVEAGDPIDVVRRPGHGVTVSMMFRALTTERALLPRLLVVDDLVEGARRKAEAYVAGR
jgi:MOSC domain-containing protein YiiM